MKSPITLSAPWPFDALHSSMSAWDLANAAAGVANADRIQTNPDYLGAEQDPVMAGLSPIRRP
jgi:hypothetical protein